MKISISFLEGTGVCARQGLKQINLDFNGQTLEDLLDHSASPLPDSV